MLIWQSRQFIQYPVRLDDPENLGTAVTAGFVTHTQCKGNLPEEIHVRVSTIKPEDKILLDLDTILKLLEAFSFFNFNIQRIF